jgi:hypothetical protein
MRWLLVIVDAGLLAAGYLPTHASLQWTKNPSKRLMLTVPRMGLVQPQNLTLSDRLGKTFHTAIPSFTVKPDRTIIWDAMDWCVEASGTNNGDQIRVNRCTGGPGQKWNWWSTSLGHEMIQLDGTTKCCGVGKAIGSHEVPIELQECQGQATDLWKFEEPHPALAQDATRSQHLRTPAVGHSIALSESRWLMTSLLALAVVFPLGVIAWLRRWQSKPRVLVMNQGAAFLSPGEVPSSAFMAANQRCSSHSSSVAGPNEKNCELEHLDFVKTEPLAPVELASTIASVGSHVAQSSSPIGQFAPATNVAHSRTTGMWARPSQHVSRTSTLRAQISGHGDGSLDGDMGSTDGGTFFSTIDGRDEDGISPEGMVPPGEDLIEHDLKRIFDLESDGTTLQSEDMDEVRLMYKLRKELGEADFKKIFSGVRIQGPGLD